MNKQTLKRIMQEAHRQAGIWVRNGHTDSYAIALSVALKAEWAQERRNVEIAKARAARQAAKERAAQRNAAMNQRTARTSYTSRRVALLETAIDQGLNHGKAWYCGERDIQTKGAAPEWEGEAICYVYA